MAGLALADVAFVQDGDTIVIDGRWIRLYGIDAPEKDQVCVTASGASWDCGDASTAELTALIASDPVTCETLDVDRYGRDVARCRVRGEDISAHMVSAGLALAYRRYSLDYAPQEDAARARRSGVWSGSFMAPWDWRHYGRRRAHAAARASTRP